MRDEMNVAATWSAVRPDDVTVLIMDGKPVAFRYHPGFRRPVEVNCSRTAQFFAEKYPEVKQVKLWPSPKVAT